MPELLFEIGTEELPAGVINPAIEWLTSAIKFELQNIRLGFGEVRVLGTPRRLVVMVRNVEHKQADFVSEIVGPKAEIAWKPDGTLSEIGEGFLRSRGISAAKAFRKEAPKGAVIAAAVETKGADAKVILPSVLLTLLTKLPFPKTMRWESSGATFSRPVRWLLAIFDGEVLPIEFAGVSSSNRSCGHRFMSPGFFEVTGIDGYLNELASRHVMLDFEKRREFIWSDAQKLAKQAGGFLQDDQELLNTVANLVEYPFVLSGDFEEKYLEVPKEVLISEMRAHQKCFAVVSKDGELLPKFILVAATKPKDDAFVAQGNGKVIRARFADGAFYYEKDIASSLSNHAVKLEKVLFQYDLGSIAEKVLRISAITRYLCDRLSLPESVRSGVLRTAELCKADLVTGVVSEFPELQGTMGRIYALKSGEAKAVGEGIEEHYWPRFAGDTLPSSDEAALVGMADRIDSLVGVIGIGKAPKGNADPFALRRAAIGLNRIIVEKGYCISLSQLITESALLFGDRLKLKAEDVLAQVQEFIVMRARGMFVEMCQSRGSEHDTLTIDGAMAVGTDDLLDVWARISALIEMRGKDSKLFDELTYTFKRAGNIVKKARVDKLFESGYINNIEVLQHVTEIELYKEIDKIEALPNITYQGLLSQVAKLKPIVDRFFDDVMVMAEDVRLRQARLGLLARLEAIVQRVADFTRIA